MDVFKGHISYAQTAPNVKNSLWYIYIQIICNNSPCFLIFIYAIGIFSKRSWHGWLRTMTSWSTAQRAPRRNLALGPAPARAGRVDTSVCWLSSVCWLFISASADPNNQHTDDNIKLQENEIKKHTFSKTDLHALWCQTKWKGIHVSLNLPSLFYRRS